MSEHLAVGGGEHHAYPVNKPPADRRFTSGLLLDISGRLEDAGFPTFTPDDLARLQRHLHQFIYGQEERP